LINSVLQS